MEKSQAIDQSRLEGGLPPGAGPGTRGPAFRPGTPFGRRLVDSGMVSQAVWNQAFDQAGGDMSQALRQLGEQGSIAPEKLLLELSAHSGLPIVEASELAKADKQVDSLPYRFLKYNRVVPFAKEDGLLKVAVTDPFRLEALRGLEQITGLKTQPWLSLEENILRRIEVHYGLGRGGMDSLGGEGEILGLDEASNLEDLSSEAPAIRLFNYLIDRAVDLAASDLHIEPRENDVHIRYRVDGILYEQEPLSKKMQSALVSRIKILARLNIAERRQAQDGKIVLRISGRDLDLRVSTLPTVHGEGVVIRILYRDTLGAELTGLGMRDDHLEQIKELIKRPYGLILVTGPTGSGKTTTLYAALQRINSPDKKIITVEDPVEYRLPGVNQIQVNPQVGLTFASGLRSIVRHDPDVILVGEIRDRETADIAIHASLTGHLVFSTLHTNEAAGAITRLQDMGVDSFLISSALTAVLAQRLVRVLCDECKAPAEYRGEHGIPGASPGDAIWTARGCPACSQMGFQGRNGIFELMLVSESIRDLINQRSDTEELRRQALAEGMRTLRQDGWLKVASGMTSLEEVLRVTSW